MANHIMYHQGKGHKLSLPDCGGGPQFTCPTSKRVAAEYHRGFYTLTNVFNPHMDNNYYGRENWQQKMAETIEVGDTVWFVYVPPKHTLYDIAVYGEKTLADASSLESLAGMQLELIVAEVDVTTGTKDDTVTCDPTNQTSYGTISFPTGTDPKETMLRAILEQFTGPEKGLVVGVVVNRMPTGKLTLRDIRSKIAVVAHVLSYDSQTHM